MGKYLKYRAKKKDSPPLQQLIQNAPENAQFYPYQTVGERHYNLPDGYPRIVGPLQFDILAKTVEKDHPSLIIECKYHEKPIGSADVEYFSRKVNDFKKEIPHLIPILYSISGFTEPAKKKMKELELSWSTPEFWDVLKTEKE